MWVLIGYGTNQLQIPAMVWSNKEAALAKCIELFGFEYETEDDKYWWNFGNDEERASVIFTHYYSGCGGCWQAELKQVEEGTPFVRWDLD